jgi:hypothetical protein
MSQGSEVVETWSFLKKVRRKMRVCVGGGRKVNHRSFTFTGERSIAFPFIEYLG